MNAVGPDAWADIVAQTLGPMGPTQHLTGTQRVSDLDVQISSDCDVTGGSAGLENLCAGLARYAEWSDLDVHGDLC